MASRSAHIADSPARCKCLLAGVDAGLPFEALSGHQIIRLSNERRRRWGLGKRGEAEADLWSMEIRYQRFRSFNKSLPSTARGVPRYKARRDVREACQSSICQVESDGLNEDVDKDDNYVLWGLFSALENPGQGLEQGELGRTVLVFERFEEAYR
jgi:hypothetical protein